MKHSYLTVLAVHEIMRMFPAVATMKNRLLRNAITVCLALFISPYLLFRFLFGFTVPYTELVVTTKCSLCCTACANLMPRYQKPYDVDMELLLQSAQRLIDSVSVIRVMGVLGGEPFMRKDLYRLINLLSGNKKVKRVKVVTNGTIIPKGDVLKALQHKRVYVSISEYPGVNREPLLETLKEHNIAYIVNHFDNWLDYGSFDDRNFEEDTLRRSYSACTSSECKTVLNGKLYTCPRSSHGDDLGLIPADPKEAVDLLEGDAKDLRKRLRAFYNLTTVTACRYCSPPWDRPPIPCGEQEPKKNSPHSTL